jgi:tRNA(Phe) wybutosine-synthesizing methylase Tyw3
VDLQGKLATELRERLGYRENVLVTRDELNLLIEGDMGLARELEEEIEELTSELEELKDNCECEKLQKKLDKILKIVEA